MILRTKSPSGPLAASCPPAVAVAFPASRRPAAFTLVEMLVVLVVIGLLMAVATPYILGSLESSQLSSAGSSLVYKLSMARQIAASRKQPVEVRLYSYAYEGASAVRGYQLFVQADAAAPETGLKALEGPEYFGDGSIVMAPGGLSPLLSGAGQSTTHEPWASRPGGATYHRIVFYPDGSTSLRSTLRQSFITLVTEKWLTAAGAGPPPNYFTVQLDPVTGRTSAYRP